MAPTIKVFWSQKDGNASEDYEDACAHSAERLAIADGATESSFAEEWAQLLVHKFVSSPPALSASPDETHSLQQWLGPLQTQWNAQVPWQRLPWYAEEKARAGAFATFLTLEIDKPRKTSRWQRLFGKRIGAEWRSVAIGDSCLFHVRQGSLVRSFPVEHSNQFGSTPPLLSSNPQHNRTVWQHVKTARGSCEEDDLLLLMTDALACWFLAEHERGTEPWTILSRIQSDDDFNAFLKERRAARQIRNDDATLMVCSWKGPS